MILFTRGVVSMFGGKCCCVHCARCGAPRAVGPSWLSSLGWGAGGGSGHRQGVWLL